MRKRRDRKLSYGRRLVVFRLRTQSTGIGVASFSILTLIIRSSRVDTVNAMLPCVDV